MATDLILLVYEESNVSNQCFRWLHYTPSVASLYHRHSLVAGGHFSGTLRLAGKLYFFHAQPTFASPLLGTAFQRLNQSMTPLILQLKKTPNA